MLELAVNPQEFGLEVKKTNELVGNLPEVIQERSVLTEQYKEIINLDIDNPQTAKRAREIRLKIRDNRTKGIDVWHKTNKDVFLRAGQFLDAIKRRENEVNERMEANLLEIEKHAENKEKQRLDAIGEARKTEIEPFAEFVPFGVDLRTMSDEDYAKLLNGAKLQMDAKIEAEKKAEAERLEREKQEELARIQREKEIEAQRIENERLKKEAEEREKQMQAEREKAREEAEKLEAKRQAELKAEKERQAKIEAQRQEELRIEREKQAKLEAELKAKREAEEKAEKERLEEIERQKKEAEKLAKAPIKKQLNVWVDSFEIQGAPVANECTDEIQSKFQAFKKWAKDKVENI